MFLHLGGDTSILPEDIIGIFDAEISKKSPFTKEFLEIAKTEKLIIPISEPDKTKSFIVTADKIYFSPISSVTLVKRSDNIQSLGEEEEIFLNELCDDETNDPEEQE